MNAPPTPAVSERSPPPVLRAPGKLYVDSDPEGAFVYIDGTLRGVTPYSADTLAPGWRTIAVERVGYAARDTLLHVAPASAVSFAPSLPARDLEPQNAEPERASPPPTPDDEPLLSQREPQREPQREASAEPAAPPVDFDGATERQRPPPDPIPSTGTLSVLVRPWGSIFVDDTLRARDTDLRWTDTVPVGRRVLRVVHPVLGVQQHSVEVQPGQTTSLVIDLF
jgi:hypothetical protein